MRRRGLVRFACAAVAALLWASSAAAVDLVGTWYVLVHYKDSATANPDTERWEDRVWVFEPAGSRLRWIEYPIVNFADDQGRFERTGRQYARVLQHWEPSERQQAEIRRGLEVNQRGRRDKAMRGSADVGWKSGGAGGAFSANTLTYTTIWEVEDPAGLPVFSISETLGGAAAESLEGVTEYRTASIDDAGILHGSFNRDGTRAGTFRMMPTGRTRAVEGGKTQEEIRSRLGMTPEAPTGEEPETDPVRAQARMRIRGQVEESARERGLDPTRHPAEIERMTERMLAEWERGKSPAQIERMIRESEIVEQP